MCDICKSNDDWYTIFTAEHEPDYKVINICKKCFGLSVGKICKGKFKHRIFEDTTDNDKIPCSFCNNERQLNRMFLIRMCTNYDKEITFCKKCNKKYFNQLIVMALALKEGINNE